MSQSPCISHLLIIIKNTNHKELAAKIHGELAQKGYTGLDTFLTSIQLPFAPLAIRNRAIRLYLEDALVPAKIIEPTSANDANGDQVITESPSDETTEPIDEGLPETISVRETIKLILSASLTTPTLVPARQSPLHIQLSFSHPTLSDAWVWLTSIPHAEFVVRMKRKRGGDMIPEGLSISRVDKALGKLALSDFAFPLVASDKECVCGPILFLHEPIWVAGRYNKLQRHISVYFQLFTYNARIHRGLSMKRG
jgi:hypothetical protein